METITITIPKKMLSNRYGTRRLVLVEPKELTQKARRRWEMEDAMEASRSARREWKQGKTRQVGSLRELM
ncbi:MAG: hypothetical protein A3A44_02450 [Candidatus Sungbacteria bacterium RIFCSPLOWO2_01_FULL_60_25]|uniref:Uncharacterized protein n=1 Tax=Candidatus Sungbacteria bacterium RIFCSPLOWO2_01_FULL_60_25 TaxID=1802281 RepID=A0A1G2LBW6_9BACT|nr:MAG: hypothetical protein A3A44_02450 [Candidatus Sungbacteria bacterium RIFCSPLOWO2_01_FULL_60_25]